MLVLLSCCSGHPRELNAVLWTFLLTDVRPGGLSFIIGSDIVGLLWLWWYPGWKYLNQRRLVYCCFWTHL